jgi:hypothetical protein
MFMTQVEAGPEQFSRRWEAGGGTKSTPAHPIFSSVLELDKSTTPQQVNKLRSKTIKLAPHSVTC